MTEKTIKLKVSQLKRLLDGDDSPATARLAKRIRELSAQPSGAYELSLDDGGSWELAEGSPQGNSERAELERRFGLPLTRLTDSEWDRVKAAATKTASDKLHIPFSKAASHYDAYIPEGYAEAITRKPEGVRGAPGKKTTNPKLAGESWMAPGRADLSEASDEDRDLIRRAEAYAFEHEMSWSEATRYVTR